MAAVKIGVAGAGVFGSYHTAKISNLDGALLSGIYDADEARAKALAEASSTPAFNTYEALLAVVDAVVIATPAVSHFELGKAALAAGKHMFVEKPVAVSVATARALANLASDKGLIFQAGHQERYVCEAMGLLSRARAPQRIDCVRHVPFTGRCGDVSAVLDLMVHDLDIIHRLAPAEILNLNAEGDRDNIAAELFLSTGTLASVSARRGAQKSQRRITIVYDDGVIEFDFIRRTLSNTTAAELAPSFDAGTAPLAIRDPLAYGAELFLNSIQSGVHHGVSGAEAADVIVWARQIEKTAGLETSEIVSEIRSQAAS
ncbi:MAG: Gfo/Idh/MocA family oxidoreductase [Pseudomonadota bacterium]